MTNIDFKMCGSCELEQPHGYFYVKGNRMPGIVLSVRVARAVLCSNAIDLDISEGEADHLLRLFSATVLPYKAEHDQKMFHESMKVQAADRALEIIAALFGGPEEEDEDDELPLPGDAPFVSGRKPIET